MKQKVLIGLFILSVGLMVLMVLVQRSQDTRNRAAGTTSYYCEKEEPTILNKLKAVPFDGDVTLCEANLRHGIGTTAFTLGVSDGKCYTDSRSCESPYTELKQMYFCKDNTCNMTDEKHFSVESCQKEANYYHHYITCSDQIDCGGECTCGNTVDGACCHSYQNENDTGCHNGMACDLSSNTCKYFAFSCEASQPSSQLNCNLQFSKDPFFGDINACNSGNNWCSFEKETCQSHCDCGQAGDWCCGLYSRGIKYCNNDLICNGTTFKCETEPVPTDPVTRFQNLYSCQTVGGGCDKFDFGEERYWKTLAECKEMYGNCYLAEDKGKCDTYCVNATVTNTPTPTPTVTPTATPTPTPTMGSGKGTPFSRTTYNNAFVCEETHIRCLADPEGTYKGGTTEENRSACQGPEGGCTGVKRYQRLYGSDQNLICNNGKYECVENVTSEMDLGACQASCASPKHYSRVKNGTSFVCEGTKYKCVEDVNGDFNWLNSDAGNLANCQGEVNSCTWTTITPTLTPTPTPINYSRAKDANGNLICNYGKYSCYARADGEFAGGTTALNYVNCQGSCEVGSFYTRAKDTIGNPICESGKYSCSVNANGEFRGGTEAKNLADCQGACVANKCSVCADIRTNYVGPDKKGGDYNCNGYPDNGDMQLWRAEYINVLQETPPTRFEANGNCYRDINEYYKTDLFGYSLWRSKYLK